MIDQLLKNLFGSVPSGLVAVPLASASLYFAVGIWPMRDDPVIEAVSVTLPSIGASLQIAFAILVHTITCLFVLEVVRLIVGQTGPGRLIGGLFFLSIGLVVGAAAAPYTSDKLVQMFFSLMLMSYGSSFLQIGSPKSEYAKSTDGAQH